MPVSEAAQPDAAGQAAPLRFVPPSTQRVVLRVVDKDSGWPVAVKLHIHGEAGEYLAPLDRHRIANPAWIEDYSTDFIHIADWSQPQRQHTTTYIPGETRLRLPLGKVYVEVSKGFEIRPVRQVVTVSGDTREIVIEIEKVLGWREKG